MKGLKRKRAINNVKGSTELKENEDKAETLRFGSEDYFGRPHWAEARFQGVKRETRGKKDNTVRLGNML